MNIASSNHVLENVKVSKFRNIAYLILLNLSFWIASHNVITNGVIIG